MMISSKTKAVVLGLWIVATASHLVHAQPTGGPGDRFVPMGHSYDTSNRQLPTLNSYDDQVNNRADTISPHAMALQFTQCRITNCSTPAGFPV